MMHRHTTGLLVIGTIAVAALVFLSGCSGGAGEGKADEKAATAAPPGSQGGPAATEGQRVIVGFKQAPGRVTEGLLRAAQARLRHRYHLIPAAAATLTQAEIESLRKQPDVAYVEPDGVVRALGEVTPWGIVRVHADQVWPGGDTGGGVKVAVIDTGIDHSHPDLAARYAGGYDFVNLDNDPMDDAGHGTHVAGTIAATDDEAGVVGAAPTASLYAVKVLDASGSGWWSDVIAGIEWCVDNGMQIANMSLGGDSAPSALEDACEAAYNGGAGILLVAAAGNDGSAAGKTDTVDYPARYASVIAVAATDSADKRASWSSTGPAVELAAPGVSVLSDYPGGATATMSGTSMASPHVAGSAALVIASGVSGAGAVRARLQAAADGLGKPTWYGKGMVDAYAAVTSTPPSEPGSVSGTVTSAATGRGIRGALVAVDSGQSATTNAKGKYTISGVPAGTHSISASATGYSPASGSVTVTSGSTTTWSVTLSPSP